MAKVSYAKGKLVAGKLVLGAVREIDPSRCPHYIFTGEHYREDGSCRCNDPKHTEMRAWGYKWNRKTERWA